MADRFGSSEGLRMNILTRLSGWWRGKSNSSTSNPQSWFTDWGRGGQESASGIVVNQLEALRDVITMACVSIRAADLAKLPVHVMRRRKDGGTEIVKGHAVERLLKKPNDWQTKFEFFEMMQACYLLRSNAYAPVIWNGRGQPTALVPVNPDRVGLYAEPGGDLFYRVTRANQHEIAQLASLPLLIPADDVLHLRGMSLDGLLGVSRIGMARDAIGLSRALETYSSSLFARGARPGGVLETDKKLSDPVFDRFQAQWKRNYTGLNNAGETPILEEGLKWKSQTMTSVEAETVAARKLQTEQIATAFDVPLHRLGIIPEGGGDAILQAHQMYLNNTLSTDAERWENKLNDMFGFDGEEIGVEFDLDYFNRADIQTRLNAYGTAITRSVYTVNDARRKEGLPDDPDGDVIFAPANMVPLGMLGKQPALPAPKKPAGPGSDTTGSPAEGGKGDPAAVPVIAGD